STGKVRLIEVATGKEGKPLPALTTGATVGHYSPDGKSLANWPAHGDPKDRSGRQVKLWDLATLSVRHTVEVEKGTVHQAAFSPDGKTLAVGSGGAAVAVYDS